MQCKYYEHFANFTSFLPGTHVFLWSVLKQMPCHFTSKYPDVFVCVHAHMCVHVCVSVGLCIYVTDKDFILFYRTKCHYYHTKLGEKSCVTDCIKNILSWFVLIRIQISPYIHFTFLHFS